ncbi:nucleotidyltransferase [bacterium]|nr:nucleotidyltransferase [bacterium]
MLETLYKIVNLLNEADIDYCLIGGLAVMLHHGRANTVDIDVYVLVDNLDEVKKIFTQKSYEIKSMGEYQLKGKVDNVPIDLLFADEYVGADVVKRAKISKLGDKLVKIATPEDIIVLKTIANRSVDRRDIEELREIYGKKLDEKYIEAKLKKVKELLA